MRDHILRIAGLADDSIVDGPGLRLAVFVQGCFHNCPGCHNPETHDPSGGRLCALEEILAIYTDNPLLDGITFSGGEPFLQAFALAKLAALIHARGGSVMTYTGYVFEELVKGSHIPPGSQSLLEGTDILVDGPYMDAMRSLDLEYRGSSNQRLLSREDRQEIVRKIRAGTR